MAERVMKLWAEWNTWAVAVWRDKSDQPAADSWEFKPPHVPPLPNIELLPKLFSPVSPRDTLDVKLQPAREESRDRGGGAELALPLAS